MKVAAIITEYNPFHRGHAYQLSQINADYVMVIMSGNYVQRGEPAIVDKWTRTEMALAGGVDLVLELPTVIATGSAEYFAEGAIFLLAQTHMVDELYFGAEHSDIRDLEAIASVLQSESRDFTTALKSSLKSGNSFAAARQQAIETLFPDNEYGKILRGSNNILAIEYLKALNQCQSKIRPQLIQRQGQRYLDNDYRQNTLLSATAIRQLLSDEITSKILRDALPPTSYQILTKAIAQKKAPIYPADIYSSLRLLLLRSSTEELSQIRENNSELLNRLLYGLAKNLDYPAYVAACASRNFPAAKIRRTLLYLFLKQLSPAYPTLENSYLKILGFRHSAAPLLKKIQANSALPVITNTRNTKELSTSAYQAYQAELRYDRIYSEIVYTKYGTVLPAPEQRKPIIYE